MKTLSYGKLVLSSSIYAIISLIIGILFEIYGSSARSDAPILYSLAAALIMNLVTYSVLYLLFRFIIIRYIFKFNKLYLLIPIMSALIITRFGRGSILDAIIPSITGVIVMFIIMNRNRVVSSDTI